MPEHEDIDLNAMIRQIAADRPGVHVVDFADLGSLPPEMRRAAHTLRAVNAVIDYRDQLIEAADVYLARQIATQLTATSADEDGGVDLDLLGTARQLATDADVSAWEELSPNGLRDVLTTSVQWVATAQHRYLPDTPEVRVEVAGMIGDRDLRELWRLADAELAEAGNTYDAVQMIPDNPMLAPLSTSPTNQAAAEIVARNKTVAVLAMSGLLQMVGRVIEINATDAWEEFLQTILG